jgi:hypothetical protein
MRKGLAITPICECGHYATSHMPYAKARCAGCPPAKRQDQHEFKEKR